jgi:predicted DNA-binding protein (UPF0251 family)
MQDCSKKGRRTVLKGKDHMWTKLTLDDVKKIRILNKEGITNREISKRMDISEAWISKIKNGKVWKDVID